MALIGLAGIIFGAVIAAAYGGLIGKSAFPVSWFYVLIVISGCMFLISAIGLTSVHKYWRYGTCGFLFLTILLLIAVAVIMTTLILYANGKSGALESTVHGVQLELEGYLFSVAMNNPAEWKNTQGMLDCCGISYEALYKKYPTGKTIDDVLTGAKCSQTENATNIIVSFLNEYPSYNASVQEVVDNNPIIGNSSDGFFCMSNILETSRKYTVHASAISGSIVFIQLLSIILVFDLFCRISEADGGFAVLGDEIKPLSSDETPSPDKEAGASGTAGAVFLKPSSAETLSQQAHNFAGRMSHRMGFAPHTPSPRGHPTTSAGNMAFGSPQSAPSTFLSTNTYASLNDGLPQPNSGLPQPNSGFSHTSSPRALGAMKDLGNRMSLGFKHTFGRGPPPPPPAGFEQPAPPAMPKISGPPVLPNLGGPPPPPAMPDLGGPKPRGPPRDSDDAPAAPSSSSSNAAKNDPKYKKYITMEKCNLPEGAIRQRMTMDGMGQAEQDAFFR